MNTKKIISIIAVAGIVIASIIGVYVYLKAFTPINDSVIVAATFNNGMVVKISTGKSQTSASTVETGVNYPGKFEIVYNQQPPNGYPKVFSKT